MTIRFNEIAEPATPPTGKVWLYVDTADSKVKTKDDMGTVTIFQPGADGKTLLNGTVAPTTEGVNGDFYINTVLNLIHGPKAAGIWPAGVSLVGPTGATGATGSTGATGAGVPVGGTANQVLSKIDGTNYNTQWVTPSSGSGGSSEGDGSYFLTNQVSDLAGGRLEMIRGIPPGGGASVAPTGVLNGDLLAEFATVVGYPSATYLPSGTLSFNIQARQLAGTKVTKLYVEFYYRTMLAVETLIATSPVTAALTGSSVLLPAQIDVPVTRGLGLTDRLTIKVRAEVTGAGTDPDLSVEFQGVTNSRCRFPFEIDKAAIGLSNVDNTSDIDKPISDDTQDALDLKADKAGTANRVAVYDNSNELAPKADWQINSIGGVDLNQAIGPIAGNSYEKLNNQITVFTPTADSEQNWYSQWYEPIIAASAFEMGDPVTGQGGVTGMGMAARTDGDYGYLRNFDFSSTATTGTTGHTLSAMNNYIQAQTGSTVERMTGLPVSLGGDGDVNYAEGMMVNFNMGSLGTSAIGYNVGGNLDYTIPANNTNFFGYLVNVNATGGVKAGYGFHANMSNVTPYAGAVSSLVIQDLTLTWLNPGDNNFWTIEYTDTATAGSETVGGTFGAIVVGIQSGVSTATQVQAAINASPGVSSILVATGGNSNPQVTQAPTNFVNGEWPGIVRAFDGVGDNRFDGDAEITGNLTLGGTFGFSGDLSVGSIQSYKQLNIITNGGNPTTNNGIVSQFDGSGVTPSCDMIGLSTPSLINLDATFAGTSGGFGLGVASLALPNIVTMAAGCSLDNLTSCAYVTLFDASNTGGTIDRLINVRATNIPQGGTQTITRSYNFFADYFAGDVATDSWGLYDSGAKYNWMANSLKIGGTGGTTDIVTNSSIGLELHDRALRLAVMDTTARNALTAVTGMVIFNTTTSALEVYDGSAWV